MAKNTKITVRDKKRGFGVILNPKLTWKIVREAEVSMFEDEPEDEEEALMAEVFRQEQEKENAKFVERLLKTTIDNNEYWFRATFKNEELLVIEEAQDALMSVEQPMLYAFIDEHKRRLRGDSPEMSDEEFKDLRDKMEEIRQSNINA